MLRRCFALFCSFAFIFVLVFPSYASATALLPGEVLTPVVDVLGDVLEGFDISEFAAHVWDDWYAGAQRGERLATNAIRYMLDNDTCLLCPDNTGRHSFSQQRTTVDGKTGLYYICEYCGKSAGEVMDTAYNDYTSTLPYHEITSDGGFMWYVTVGDFVSGTLGRKGKSGGWGFSPSGTISNFPSTARQFSWSCDSFSSEYSQMFGCTFNVPVSGYYHLLSGKNVDFTYLNSSNVLTTRTSYYTDYTFSWNLGVQGFQPNSQIVPVSAVDIGSGTALHCYKRAKL